MLKINALLPQDKLFQQRLNNVEKTIKKLYYLGQLFDPDRPVVAIVGSRKPSAYGQEATYTLAYELAARGVVIVSGLALGADAIAHTAALDAGGTTVAVLPASLSTIYPASNRGLATRIIRNGGMLLSEYVEPVPPRKYQFLERNRIIAGICDGVLITEATQKSGTLSTARFAIDQGRCIMAIPGQITNSLSEGCHSLVRSGAALVRSYKDVLEEINYIEPQSQLSLPLAETAHEATLIALLQQGVSDAELLAASANIPIEEFQEAMTALELRGRIRPLGNNRWMIRG